MLFNRTAALRHHGLTSLRPPPLQTPLPALPLSGALPAGRHRVHALLECLTCLCPRVRLRHLPDEVTTTARSTRSDAGETWVQLTDFQLPRGPGPSTLVTALRDHPQGARYSVLPPGFPTREALPVYELPGLDGRSRYRECQGDRRCGLALVNMLAMELAGYDFRVLASGSELHGFVARRQNVVPRREYLEEHLRDFLNHRMAGAAGPVVGLATAVVREDGSLAFDPAASPVQQADIDASAALGLILECREQGRQSRLGVLVCRVGTERFEFHDPRLAQSKFVQAATMTAAVVAYVARSEARRAGGDPSSVQRFSLLYPSSEPAVAMGVASAAWL